MERRRGCATVAFTVFSLFILPLQAQEGSEVRRLNSNAAFTVSAPLNATSAYTTVGWGFVYGAGFNISRHHSFVGEVMWNSLPPNDTALAPIRAALQNNSIQGSGNLVTLTGNYRVKLEGKVFGTYLIGGGGLYYRNANLSQVVTVGNSVACTPAWLSWGFTCSSGFVTANQSLKSASSTVFGGNFGVGFTVRIPDSHYNFYLESRYHYAPTKGVHTQLLPITVGVRF